MEEKEQLLKEIAAAEAEIRDLEQKRLRSQSELFEAILDKTEPNARDVEYFKTLGSIIKLQRAKLQMLTDRVRGL